MRYDCSVSADVAIEKGNRTWCFDRFIYVSKAAYDKEGKLVNHNGTSGFHHKLLPIDNPWQGREGCQISLTWKWLKD